MHQAIKLIWILATLVLVTNNNEVFVLKKILYIKYPVKFQKKYEQIKALFNNSSKVNFISFDFTWKLGFNFQKTHDGAQKIDDSTLRIFGMVIADF